MVSRSRGEREAGRERGKVGFVFVYLQRKGDDEVCTAEDLKAYCLAKTGLRQIYIAALGQQLTKERSEFIFAIENKRYQRSPFCGIILKFRSPEGISLPF